ncbi:electron transfer flavoprotein subunit beta/FixA family protein [uncultured Actinomyces sp.]|uniref:electron transfer flavoprotein subunit beta/FixA family protein n=1 Tax=uncultured Actinomyces sp. TaxID=249061 RepID=UPI002804B84B|nr:electron transfer flavoprotein subunit beta/FixA family protein [uncultured Actinomyces sp.]
MRIVVCIKHVPDVQSERRIEDGRLVRGEEDVLNELDENAVEAAVCLAEEADGEVIALTMGPEDAEDGVRRALQMGADSGVVVADDDLAGADVVTTARVLAAAIERIGEVDLVVTGMASLDSMTSMLPGALAAKAHMPLLGLARTLSVEDGVATIERSVDGFTETLRAALPAVVSVTDQINEPRYPAFAAMKAARKKPLDQWGIDDLVEVPGGETLVMRRALTSVTFSEENVRDGSGTIIQDAGEGGRALADYILSVVK